MEVLIEFLLREPCRSVEALQHGAIFVAAPVSACYAHQLERANLTRMLYVRTTAEIEKVVLLVDRDFIRPICIFLYTTEFRKVVLLLVNTGLFMIWQVFDNFNLIGLSLIAEVFQCLET